MHDEFVEDLEECRLCPGEAQHSVQSKKLALTGKPAASVPLAASLTREIQASVVGEPSS